MADLVFERELDRMFAEAPACPDADGFAARVEARIARGWTTRRLLIGALGLAGGVIAGAQLLGGGIIARLGQTTSEVEQLVNNKAVMLAANNLMLNLFPMSSAVLWVAASLAGAGLAFALTRVLREF